MNEQRREADRLRPLDRILEPDLRSLGSDFYGTEAVFRQRQFEDHYGEAAAHLLHEGIPDEIWRHFETARTIYVYAWFDWRMLHVAELHALGSLEMALRKKYSPEANRRIGLRALLEQAVDECAVVDEGMREWRRRADALEEAARGEGAWPELPGLSPPEDRRTLAEREPQAYVKKLARDLPKLRNDLAHGSGYFYPRRALVLELCCDLINQLFPRDDSGTWRGAPQQQPLQPSS